MAANGVQRGHILGAIAPAGGVTSGVPVIIGTMFLIPTTTAAAGEPFEGAVVGVWELAKTSADTPTQFAKAYWDNTNSRVTTTSSGNTEVGVFTEARANGTTTAPVRLNGFSI